MNKVQNKRFNKLLGMAVRTVEENKELQKLEVVKTRSEALKDVTRTKGVSVSVSRDADSDNTLSFVFVSNDNGGKRYDWGTGDYYTEELVVGGANLERLNTFFKDHHRSVDSAVGKVGNPRVEGGQLIGDVTFGTDDGSQRVFSKYLEGILTDVSIGYEIRDYEVVQGADNELDTVRVTNFDIFEVSAVGIGFDGGAKKREKDENVGSSKMNKEELERFLALQAMVERTADETAEMKKLMVIRDNKELELETERKRLLDENIELKRQADVNATCDAHNVSSSERKAFIDNKDMNIDAVRAKILADLEGVTPPHSQKIDNPNARSNMIDGMVDALAMRAGANIENPHADAEKYRYASLVSIGNLLLPESERSFNPSEVAERSLLTGDFPLLLQSVGARVLTTEFEAQTASYKAWMKEVDVPDFRVMTDLTTSTGGGRLDKTLENGDLRELSGTEKGESWKIESFGNKFVLTREMIINDDLGNFTNLIATFGQMAMTTANGIAYDILQGKGDYSSYKMADGSGIYVGARNNSATAILSPDAISAGRLAMSKHMSVDGNTPLNITPKYLIVTPALEQVAREILGATNKISADANTGEINVHQNSLELIVDSEITSDTAWYMLADRRTFKMGFLQGTNRSPVTKLNDTSISRTIYEGVFDIGATVEDYRGLYRGNV